MPRFNRVNRAMQMVVLAALWATPAAALDAEKLVREIETQYQSASSYAIATMTIVTEDWSRELKMESWGEGRDKFLTRILAPKKEAGISTLKLDDEIWNYLPRIDRLMKVPSSMMGEGWMGSHFTNDDLVKESKIDTLYTFEVAFEGPLTAAIIATPKPDAAVVWGEIRYTADHKRMVPIQVDYYDEDQFLVRTMTFTDVQTIDGRDLPMVMTIRPLEEPDEYTEVRYDKLTLKAKPDKRRFTLQALRKR